jgi:hypothetical protein
LQIWIFRQNWLRVSRPLTRSQQLQNAAFLRALRRTGNVREAARAIGVAYGTMQHRRGGHPAFAQRWDAALVFAQARLAKSGLQGPEARKNAAPTRDEPVPSDGSAPQSAGRQRASRDQQGCSRAHRTLGGEPVVVRRNDGKLQMRRAQPDKLTKQCEQAFLAALSATANVRLSAAAAGAAEAAFYRRKRNNPAFAREWRLALAEGYERLELALLASSAPESFEDDHWRRNDRPEMPPMTCSQALQLMYLHQKEARLLDTPIPVDRLRPGETWEARSVMLGMIAEARRAQEREAFRIAEAERLVTKGYTWIDWEAEGNPLPDLAQVTGWSRASGKPGADEERALFGGWRVGDMKRRDND